MESLLLLLLILLLGLAVFVGVSIRNHSREVARNAQEAAVTPKPAVKEPA